jgi:hypothetical protein
MLESQSHNNLPMKPPIFIAKFSQIIYFTAQVKFEKQNNYSTPECQTWKGTTNRSILRIWVLCSLSPCARPSFCSRVAALLVLSPCPTHKRWLGSIVISLKSFTYPEQKGNRNSLIWGELWFFCKKVGKCKEERKRDPFLKDQSCPILGASGEERFFRVQWNRAILLDEGLKLDPQPLDQGPSLTPKWQIEAKPIWHHFGGKINLVWTNQKKKKKFKNESSWF